MLKLFYSTSSAGGFFTPRAHNKPPEDFSRGLFYVDFCCFLSFLMIEWSQKKFLHVQFEMWGL